MVSPRRSRLTGLVLLASLATLVTSIVPAAPASADHFGGSGGPAYVDKVADGKDHSYCFYSNIIGSERDVYEDGMALLDAQTVMFDMYHNTCHTYTDIMYLDNPNLGYWTDGLTLCVNQHSSSVCDGYWIATDFAGMRTKIAPWQPADLGYASWSVQETKLVMHETGHSVGLNHDTYTNSWAMETEFAADLGIYNFLHGLYLSHHISAHINPTYGP